MPQSSASVPHKGLWIGSIAGAVMTAAAVGAGWTIAGLVADPHLNVGMGAGWFLIVTLYGTIVGWPVWIIALYTVGLGVWSGLTRSRRTDRLSVGAAGALVTGGVAAGLALLATSGGTPNVTSTVLGAGFVIAEAAIGAGVALLIRRTARLDIPAEAFE